MLSKVLYLMVFGALGGFLAWLVTEPFTSDDIRRSVDWTALSLYGAVSGGLIGGMIGFATGLAWGTPLHMLRGALLGAAVGLLGGTIGVVIGQILYAVLVESLPVVGLIVGRILGWSAFGALVGLAEGVVARSPRRMYQGLLGGAIGGALGGALFDFLAFTVGTVFGLALRAEGEVGAPSRAVALVLLGAGIGLFIGLIELVARQAWVRVLYGAREGKDYPIDRSGAIIGRDELADVPLRGDPTVAPRHAEIQIQGGAYLLVPHAETRVNGQPVQTPVELDDGDQIQIGSFRMVFQLRVGEAVSRPKDVVRSPLPPPPPVPAGACPYCGLRPDPITGACACTPVAAPVSSPATTAQSGAPTLVGLEGALAGQRITVPPTGLTIGREQDNTLIIPDPAVSRHHARIAIEGGEVVLYDLGSTNGTFVNNMRITRHALRRGDVVRLGGTSFRVE
ncbi:MAG: FHA domain-containing protein [Armatimonadetes bacterium]|nr:FHA domain-containing protein [Armatimonadota bacterium]CUU34790.1 Forkhead associated (FHA) domain, binds pSer, pThr, pTyr [Armatimonadetes bacterium DC]